MRINAGQVGQVVLSTLQGAKELDGKLELKVGSVVRATLMQQAGKDEVWLQIGGKNVRARLDANVKPGDQVDLLVTGEQKQGAMELKVVGQPIKSGEGGKQQLDIAGLVRALGLPETEETKALVQELASRGVPLKQETVRAALAVLRSLPQVTPSHITTLGKMAELGIPILPSTFDAMHTLEAGPKLHDLLTKIQSALQGLFPESASGADTLPDAPAPGRGATATASGAANAQTGNAATGTANGQAGGAATGTASNQAGNAVPGTANSQQGSLAAGTANSQAGSIATGTANSQAGSIANGTANSQAGSTAIGTANSQAGSTATGTANSQAGSTETGTAISQAGNPATGTATSQAGSTATGTANNQAGSMATGTANSQAGNAATGTANPTGTSMPSGTATSATATSQPNGAATGSFVTSAGTTSPAQAGGTTPGTPNPQTGAAAPHAVHFPGNTQSSPAAGVLSAPTRANLEQLLHVTTQLLQGADDTAQQAGQLADKAKQLGLNFEEQLAHALRRLPLDSDPAQISQTFQHALKTAAEGGASLKHALLLAQASAAELDAAGLGALQQDLSTVLKNVTGQQLMQTSGGDRADLMYQFAAVPIRHGKDEQTVELHVMARKSPGQKTIDPANCYVLFRLDMPNLGELDIHLHIVDKVVGVRFLSEHHAEMKLTPTDQRDLRDALQKVGFHLGVLKVEDKKQQEAGAAQPLLPPILTQKQFDLKI